MTTSPGIRPAEPRFWSVVSAFAVSDSRILWRMRTPLAFMFAVPAVLSLSLGPAVSGGGGAAAGGRSMIGIAVLFSLMTVNYVGLALFREFTNNTWIRQAVSQPAKLAFLVGKVLPVAGAGMIQLTVFGAIAFIAYGTPLHGSVLQLLVVAVALVAVGCAIGALLYIVTRTTSTFQSLAYIVLITTGCVGGSVVPDSQLPPFSRFLGLATPQHWALRALDESTSGGGSWGPTLQAVAIIAAMTLVCGVLAWRALDYRNAKSAQS
ncbi:ABC transporter permease [Fodinicola acaciae]|uniref:ABC transporter permease n=1 Tax=Fodinicola acaciae TaxID=2681555 RepID=UPI0013CF4911|nr:ABC transporter permease [Fodinicola acaciae]